MKKKALPILVVIGLIVLIIGGIFLSKVIQKYSPTKERADLTAHYNLASDDAVAIVLNNSDSEYQATVKDGQIFISYEFLHDNINPRFYWDNNENLLLYTSPTTAYQASINETSYSENKSPVDFGHEIVLATEDSCLVNLDFVKLFTAMDYSFFEDPNRVVITTDYSTITVATIKKGTAVRELGGIKSPIMEDLEKGATVTVINEDDNWTQVMTDNGFIGYVKSSTLKDKEDQELTTDFVEDKAAPQSRNYSICLGWHGVYNTSANGKIGDVLSDSKNINVISPTWFSVKDNDGNISDLASSSYISKCHENGVEVWALVGNIEYKDIDSSYILTHTSVRTNLVNQIVSTAISYDLDGINLDFEALKPEIGDAYIQFIRELSIKLRNNGIVLSVDNYAPSEYTSFYNLKEQALYADYIVIMAYDQHYAGSEETGSVAALDWVQESVDNTISKGVPAEQLVLAMPFYTRLWCKTPQSNYQEGDDVLYTISSQALSMNEASSLLNKKGAEKTWLESEGQFYATYTENNNIYEIWMEDTDSLEERLKLMQNSNLAGCAFWRLGFETSDCWSTISKYIK